MLAAQLRGSSWIRQFILAFPQVGALSQRYTYPIDSRTQSENTLRQADLFRFARYRFGERAKKAGNKNNMALWAEASDQQLKGWLSAPFHLTSPSSSSCAIAGEKRNIDFRFGAAQGEKLGACDGLKHSLASLACSVLTPITLTSWGHVEALCRRAISSHFDWEFP